MKNRLDQQRMSGPTMDSTASSTAGWPNYPLHPWQVQMRFEPFARKLAMLRLVSFDLGERRARKFCVERRQRRKITVSLITCDLRRRQMMGRHRSFPLQWLIRADIDSGALYRLLCGLAVWARECRSETQWFSAATALCMKTGSRFSGSLRRIFAAARVC
jgi:hypothetical protein